MIQIEKDGDLWTLILDRPGKANALTREMLVDLAEAVQAAGQSAKVLILTGRGRTFSAGMDLEAANNGLATDTIWEVLSGRLAALPCLTIAALNGTVAGGALGMVLACDLRLAVPEAKIFYPVMRLGFLPQPSDPRRLTSLVGPSRARRILMAGEKVPADKALQWGLLDAVVPAAEMGEQIKTMAADALGAGRKHIAGIKALLS